MGYLASAAQILVNFAFVLLISLIVLRVLLQIVRANFYNPVCQFLYKITNPVLMPMRKLIPAWRNLDLAGVLLAWLLCALKLYLLYVLDGRHLGLAGLPLIALADLLDFLLMLYFGLILVRVLLSFVNVDRANPVVPLIYQLADPVLRPIRKRLPAVAGLDLSPMVVMLVILLARVLLVGPVLDFGLRLSQGA